MFSPTCPMCGSLKVEEQIISETSVAQHYEKQVEFCFEAPIFLCNSEGCSYAWGDERYHFAKDEAIRDICSRIDTEKYNNATFDLDGMIWK